MEIREHWVFAAIECFARNAAQSGGFVPQLEAHGVLSIELPIGEGPAGWLKDNGMLGALIDVPPQDQRANTVESTPIKPVRIVPITILTGAEVDVCAGSAAERTQLAQELGGHVTDPTRAPLR